MLTVSVASQLPAVQQLQQLLRGLDQARLTRERLEEQLKALLVGFVPSLHPARLSKNGQTTPDTDVTAKLLAAGKGPLDSAEASLLAEFDAIVATVAKAISDSSDLLARTKVGNAVVGALYVRSLSNRRRMGSLCRR